MIYLLTAVGLSPGGSSTVHIYTQTIHRTTQNKQYIEQYKNFARVRAVPRLGDLYPDICLTTEEKVRKALSQGSSMVRVGRHLPSAFQHVKYHIIIIIIIIISSSSSNNNIEQYCIN